MDASVSRKLAALFLSATFPALLLAACADADARTRHDPFDEGAGKVAWSCDFEGDYCGMSEQSKVEPEHRSTFVPIARHGKLGIKLTTLPGDDQVHGAGKWERDDLELPPSPEYCNEGQEEWWAVSFLFPDDYTVPEGEGLVMDFHDNASHGQANMHLLTHSDQLRLHGFAGDDRNPTEYKVELGKLTRNKWYDVVFHMKWSSGHDGFMQVWMNGRKVMGHRGPTLYKGYSCYFKLANYHDPSGPSSIVFDRVVRGTTARSVALARLER
jgi:hypothetical protein